LDAFGAFDVGIFPFGMRQRGAGLLLSLVLRSCDDPAWDGVVNVACSTPVEGDGVEPAAFHPPVAGEAAWAAVVAASAAKIARKSVAAERVVSPIANGRELSIGRSLRGIYQSN
jgi:hypothetical protein